MSAVIIAMLINIFMVAVAFYLGRRRGARAFALVTAVICATIYILGLIYTKRMYDDYIAREWIVEGKALFGGFFILSAFAGAWLGVAMSRLVEELPMIRARRVTRVLSAAVAFIATFIASIPAGIFLGFAVTYSR